MKPQVLKGFRDYLPADMLARRQLIAVVEGVFRSYGFAPLDTPALEYAELLLGKYGDEGDKLLFRFLDNGERDVALRYDLTVPLARVLGSNPEILMPFRRYQIANVWRAEKPARGRFREFMQCDVDIVGVPEMAADAEVICTGMAALQAAIDERWREAGAGAPPKPSFKLRLSNRKLLNALLEKIGLPQASAFALFRIIDKLEKQGVDVVRGLLASEVQLAAAQIEDVFGFLALTNVAQIERYFAGAAAAAPGLGELTQVLGRIDEHGLGHAVELDLSIARGLDYYGGSVYETFISDMPGMGSVMSGGRYDQLLDMFTGKPTPAVGISIGLDRLLSAFGELLGGHPRGSPTSVLVTVFSPELRAHATQQAAAIRSAGIATELYLGDDKFKKQFQYADRQGIPLVVICGPDEQQQGLAKIKDMRGGSEATVAVAALADKAKEILQR